MVVTGLRCHNHLQTEPAMAKYYLNILYYTNTHSQTISCKNQLEVYTSASANFASHSSYSCLESACSTRGSSSAADSICSCCFFFNSASCAQVSANGETGVRRGGSKCQQRGKQVSAEGGSKCQERGERQLSMRRV